MLQSDILRRLKSMADLEAKEGMARFGIASENAYGVSVPKLRSLARELGKNHVLAQQLWTTGVHEARLLASMVDDPKAVTGEQMEAWAKEFDSWDIVDQCCSNLFDRTVWAYPKAMEWSERNEEFVKRAGFVLMATLAVHDKAADDRVFEGFLPCVEREAGDERNLVKKAVNWALRQIGKRNRNLNGKAIEVAERLLGQESRSARWIASDALRELTSEAVQSRMARR